MSLFSYNPRVFFSITLISLMLAVPMFSFSTRPPRTKPTPPVRNTPTPRIVRTLNQPKHPTLTATPKAIIPSNSQQQAAGTSGKILFGMGSEADGALNSRLVREAPVRMLTSWYNGPNDLSWMTGWKHTLVPDLYAKGYTLHLITFTDYPETTFQTKYGPACGREYPLSSRFQDDMRQLAETFKGNGPLYVTLFTEFQTYPCTDNVWVGNENYYQALKDQFRAAQAIFRQTAPNAKVTISWGGWQTRWDDQAQGGGTSLFPHFADIMRESDFSSFQAMESGTNVQDIRDMTKALAAYKKPVMISHYKPDNGSQATYDADTKAIFTDAYIHELTTNGVFAFSFMDDVNQKNSESTYQFIKNSVSSYGKLTP